MFPSSLSVSFYFLSQPPPHSLPSDLHFPSAQSLNTIIYSHYLESNGKTKGRLSIWLKHTQAPKVSLRLTVRGHGVEKKKAPRPINR